MPGDKPSFLQSVPETEEEKDIMSVLEDEPQGESKEEGDDKQPESKPDSSDSNSDDSATNSDSDSSDGGSDSDDGDAGDNSDTTDSKSSDDTNSGDSDDKKSDDENKKDDEEVEKLLEMKFGNFKTPEEAEKAYKELQRTLTRVRQQATQTPTNKEEAKEQKKAAQQYIELAKKTPLVDVQLPKPENYQLSNGNFDMAGYSRDLTRNIVMSIQQGLIGGQLGSLQFGLMSEALGEEWASSKQEQAKHDEAKSIEQGLYKEYPILKENQGISEMYEKVVLGEWTRRQNKDGKNAKPLTEKDYFEIAEKLIKSLKIESIKQKEDPTEEPKGGTPMTPDGKGNSKLTGVDKDIEEMTNLGKRTGSIF